jgi:hypothetical protein
MSTIITTATITPTPAPAAPTVLTKIPTSIDTKSPSLTVTVTTDEIASPSAETEDYSDIFVTLSPTQKTLTVHHPGIPFLGSEHKIPFHQIHFLKSAADLDLLPSEYKVWGPGHSWIWWAWDLRRAGFLKKTERERCFVARIEVAWVSVWIGFTVVDKEKFVRSAEACGLLNGSFALDKWGI